MILIGGDKDQLLHRLKAGFWHPYSSKIFIKTPKLKMERFMQELMVVTIDKRDNQTESTIALPTVSSSIISIALVHGQKAMVILYNGIV